MRRIHTYMLLIMTVSSCESLTDAFMDDIIGAHHHISGQILDTEDNRLEHIRVTIDWNNGKEKSVKYTASDGVFAAELPKDTYYDGMTITVTIEDIDGEENGGMFNSLTDNVVFSSGPESPTGILTYRLTRATL